MSNTSKFKSRARRQNRVRAKLTGTAQRPRLSVFRSGRYIYAQLIDDTTSKTLLSVSTLKEKSKSKPIDKARAVGKKLAELAKSAGIKLAAFDRGGYAYHGRVKALAEGAREGGLQF